MKKKQPTVADVLHLAADKYLLANNRHSEDSFKQKFSCCAIEEAIYRITGCTADGIVLRRRIEAGLQQMGCDTGSSILFKQYGDSPFDFSYINPEVQGMRYMWLKWAALMAEEQGV